MVEENSPALASRSPLLIIFGGLPGTGKTTIARLLARQLDAAYVRIDSIEQAIRGSGAKHALLDEAGYRVGYALAEDNLRLGRAVIADCVNPIGLTREAWRDVARRAHASAIEIEIACSDVSEHRRRVESRVTDIPGLKLPTWQDVVSREYHPWDGIHIRIDTAGRSPEQTVALLRGLMAARLRDPS